MACARARLAGATLVWEYQEAGLFPARHQAPAAHGLRAARAEGTRIKSINRSWENVRAAAGIPDVRLHDLRHSFASDALMCGAPLAVVGAMLGHKHDRTTQRYAHLANSVVRDGLEAATDRIVGATREAAVLTPPPFERLTERQWKRIAAIVEATRGTCGGTRTDLRRAVDAVRWVLHNGAKWREMPKNLGRATTCWRWYERWCGNGTWAKITAALDLPEIEVGREPRHVLRGPRGPSRRSTSRPSRSGRPRRARAARRRSAGPLDVDQPGDVGRPQRPTALRAACVLTRGNLVHSPPAPATTARRSIWYAAGHGPWPLPVPRRPARRAAARLSPPCRRDR
jgi:transposase